MSIRRISLLFLALAFSACSTMPRTPPDEPEIEAAAPSVAVDIDRIATALAGSFTSAEQSAADPETYTHVYLESRRIWPRRTDGVWLYLERAVAVDIDRPYQQLVLQLTLDASGACRIDTYDLPGDRLEFAGAWRVAEPLADLDPADLLLRDGCAIIVRSEGDGVLVGETQGDDCPSTRGGAAYATSALIIEDDMLVWWDRGYNPTGRQVWGPPFGGYLFKRTGQPMVVAKSEPAPAVPAPAPRPSRYQRAADFSASRGGRALVVMEGGEVVFEQYDHGYDARKVHPIASGTVSFWGLLAAAAAQDGLIGLDDLASDTILEWQTTEGKKDVTVRQLLHFTSGLDPGVRTSTEREVPDRFQYAISLSMVAEPGAEFGYGPSHLEVFGEMVYRKLLPEPPAPHEYLERRVLDRIGMNVERWHTDEAGNAYMFFGANVTAREWARLGEFVRKGGTWDGQVVIEPEYMAQVLRGSEVRPDFGMGFWLGRAESEGNDVPADIIRSTGSGQQRLYIIPSRELVVARLGVDKELPEAAFLQLLLAE